MGAKKGTGKRSIAGIIVFDGERFLLLHRVLHWRGWEYPKGEIDAGESIGGAIARELFEETGIKKFELISFIDEVVFFDKFRNTDSDAKSYLVRVPSTVKVSFGNQPVEDGARIIEHDKYKWCQPGEALKLLTHKDMKVALGKAIKVLGIEVK